MLKWIKNTITMLNNNNNTAICRVLQLQMHVRLICAIK